MSLAMGCGGDDVLPAGTLDAAPALDGGTEAGNVSDAGGSTDAESADAGVDIGPSSDVGPADDAATGGACPPSAPFGVAVGDIAPDAMLEDCDGNPVSLHSMCGQSAVWLYRFSEWCPPCQRFVRNDAENFYQRYVPDGVQAALVIAQNSSGSVATRSDCARMSEQFGVSFPVLIDPRGEMNNLGIRVNAESMVFDSEMRILYSEQYDHDGIPAAVMSALD